jgi:hypothetical protein
VDKVWQSFFPFEYLCLVCFGFCCHLCLDNLLYAEFILPWRRSGQLYVQRDMFPLPKFSSFLLHPMFFNVVVILYVFLLVEE